MSFFVGHTWLPGLEMELRECATTYHALGALLVHDAVAALAAPDRLARADIVRGRAVWVSADACVPAQMYSTGGCRAPVMAPAA